MSSQYSDTTPGPAVQYAYMFEKDKGPTKQFDALLRAIARHVVREIGDKSDQNLTPGKLAAFYQAVGGNYDSLFEDMPHSSISYIWQVTGCQHTLQPTGDDFQPPTIPALTFRGFSRWESLEVLLGPEEHVPFLQYAVKNWNLKHPETGEVFPADLPVLCFPTHADQDVDRWHKTCADKLWTAAASSSNDEGTASRHSPPNEKPEPRFTYVHVRDPFNPTSSPRPRYAEGEYFGRQASYAHVPRRYASQRKAERSPDRPRRDNPLDDRGRRKSFSDYASHPPPNADSVPPRGYSPTHLDPNVNRPSQARRHSHPRPQSTDSSEGDTVQDQPEKRRRHPNSPPSPSVRRFVRTSASSHTQGSSNGSSNLRPPRMDNRVDETKRRNGPSPLGSLRDKLTETVSSILPNGLTSDRPRAGSRQNSGAGTVRSRRSREQVRPSRLSRSYSDMDTEDSEDPATTESDARRRRRLRDDRERDKERERERHQRGRDWDDWDDDREPGQRREKTYMRRPDTQRRTSSHADIDRQRDPPEWDPRDQDRERLRDERRKWRRRPSPEIDLTSPAAAMASRQMHPEAAYS
ncbi:hypothetical protein QQS21_010974 [Conoideocrella luteorostrata]|uniref:DUF7514 domain-containing protein n=1 Tax=Conoideocrella luteorostrata TaxID=1105319 RepID=A0AAJ0CGR7_9HYPO|nr:hypothetical protein QQS21_010974 [Conoideocrella luteorostrata]